MRTKNEIEDAIDFFECEVIVLESYTEFSKKLEREKLNCINQYKKEIQVLKWVLTDSLNDLPF